MQQPRPATENFIMPQANNRFTYPVVVESNNTRKHTFHLQRIAVFYRVLRRVALPFASNFIPARE